MADARFFTDQDVHRRRLRPAHAGGVEALRLRRAQRGAGPRPTYTAKAMAALVAHARSGELTPDDTMVFLHTGGAPATLTTAAALAVADGAGWQIL